MTKAQEMLDLADEEALANFIYAIRSYDEAEVKAKLLWPLVLSAQPQSSKEAREKEITRLATIEECAMVAESYPSSGEQTEHPVEYWIRRLSHSRPLRQGENN
jgi:hypothetical protein